MLTQTRVAGFTSIKLPQPDLGLKERDPEMASLLKEEIKRQKKGNWDTIFNTNFYFDLLVTKCLNF